MVDLGNCRIMDLENRCYDCGLWLPPHEARNQFCGQCAHEQHMRQIADDEYRRYMEELEWEERQARKRIGHIETT